MNIIPASAAAKAAEALPLDHDAEAASGAFAAAGLLLPHLEHSQCIDGAALRGAMEAVFGASDATGAWTWKLAYDACEAATVLFLRKPITEKPRSPRRPIRRPRRYGTNASARPACRRGTGGSWPSAP